MRILIVEDEKTLAGQLAEQLRLSGFVTDLCHDGNEAGFLGETEPTTPSFWISVCRAATA